MRRKYVYNFDWMGRPIIQYPQDIVAMHELIWSVRPDLIIETGIAHGGSLVLSASCLTLLDVCDAIELGEVFDPKLPPKRRVVGLDIDIRPHNREAIEKHPMSGRITMIEGSSISEDVRSTVHEIAQNHSKIMVCLDSMHTREHVLEELNAYAPLVSQGSYCVVFDTFVEDMPAGLFPDRPWGPGDSPKNAVNDFLATHPEFEADTTIESKLMLTVAPNGFLRRI